MGEEKCDRRKPSKQTENPLKCPLCSKSFRSEGKLRHHTYSHTKEKPFKCNHCDFTTAYSEHLGIHIEKKHEDKSVWEQRQKFKCTFCSFKTWLKATWEYHMTTHKGERNFPCKFSECSYAARGHSVFWQHYRTVHSDSDDRPFSCKVEGCS